MLNKHWRKSQQHLLPEVKTAAPEGNYDIYPVFKLDHDQIHKGFESIAAILLEHKTIIIDGYIGVFYDQFREKTDAYLKRGGLRTSWKETYDFLKHPDIIDEMVYPFTGGDDTLFGKRTNLGLE